MLIVICNNMYGILWKYLEGVGYFFWGSINNEELFEVSNI